MGTHKTNNWAQTGHMCRSGWIYYSKSHMWWNWFSQVRGRGVNHYDCSQTAGFSRDTLRLGSYHSSPERQNTQIRSLWALSMSSGWGEGYHDMKNVYSLAPIIQALKWLRHCGNQANSWLCVCGRMGGGGVGLSTRAGLLHSAVFAEINPAFPVVPDSRRCLCQLSAMPLCSILLAVCCRDCCPTLSTQPLVFLTIPARTAGTAVLWVPTAF